MNVEIVWEDTIPENCNFKTVLENDSDSNECSPIFSSDPFKMMSEGILINVPRTVKVENETLSIPIAASCKFYSSKQNEQGFDRFGVVFHMVSLSTGKIYSSNTGGRDYMTTEEIDKLFNPSSSPEKETDTFHSVSSGGDDILSGYYVNIDLAKNLAGIEIGEYVVYATIRSEQSNVMRLTIQ